MSTNGVVIAGIERAWRENAETKARRLLIEGRLIVRSVTPDRIEAACRGSEEVHTLGFDNGAYWCSCPARGRCSHLTALQLVTLRPEASS